MQKQHLMPFNLQFFAKDVTDASGADGGISNGEQDNPTGENKPTYDELMEQLAQAQTQIAQANATSERYKNSINDLTKKNGELTKQVRERMDPEELRKTIMQEAEAARKESEAEKDAVIQSLQDKLNVIDNTSFWGGASIGMDEALAKSTAEAEALGDKEKFRANIVKHIKAIKENALQEALKERTDIKAGNGDTDKNSLAKEMAVASAKRAGTANESIFD